MNKQRTPIKLFAVNTLFLNLLLGAALIYISVEISGSYKAPEYVYAAIPSVIALIPCWVINLVLFRKEKLNEIVLALTYSAIPIAYYVALIIMRGLNWDSLFTSFFFSFIPTFIAYMLLVTNVTLSNNDT